MDPDIIRASIDALVTAINNRDYSLIQGAVLFSAIMFVFCNMLVDIAYMILNPKVKGA